MKREFSAGGIVFNRQGQVLLISNMAMRDPGKTYWGLPKGHLAVGEKSAAAAVREIKEETGIEARIVQRVGDSRYIFVKDKEKVLKTVTVFLMEQTGGDIKAQLAEVQSAVWADPNLVMTRLSFPADTELFKKAVRLRDGQR